MDGMEQFKDLWIQTARERVQALGDLLLKLEKNSEDNDLINELMRTGHSLKGESGAMGYNQIAALSHVIEDLFTGIGNGDLKMTAEITDQLLAAIDYIAADIDNIEAGKEEADSAAIIDKIKELTGLTTEGFGKSDKSKIVAKEDDASEVSKTDEVKKEETVAAKPEEVAAEAKVEAKQVSTVTMKIEKLDQLLSVNEELVLLKMKLKNNSIVEENAGLKVEIHRLDRLVTDMQFHLMQARLFPISLALHTLPRLVRDTSMKTGRKVRLEIEGEDTTVDRTIIDHLTEPFVHMIRNSVDHGIELPEDRLKAGKSEEGIIKMKAYTKENKFLCDVADDGQGIEWSKLSKKAVDKGFFSQEEIDGWSEKDKAQLLFMDGLSASDVVSDVSGRGVGLGAVNEAIKKLGGSINVDTVVGQGTTFTLKLPMTLAIMQALLVDVHGQIFAMPSHEVVRSIQVDPSIVQFSANVPVIVVDEESVPLIDLAEKFGKKELEAEIVEIEDEAEENNLGLDFLIQNLIDKKVKQSETNKKNDEIKKDRESIKHKTIVIIKRDDKMFGCIVDKIVAEDEILVKPLGPLLKQSTYFSGVTILADGSAAPIINYEGMKWKQVRI